MRFIMSPSSEGINEFKENCNCRKPNAGMLLQAISELNIDPQRSFMVGDKIEDLQAGNNANVKYKILVRTGKAVTDEGEKLADFVLNSVANLPDLVQELVANEL